MRPAVGPNAGQVLHRGRDGTPKDWLLGETALRCWPVMQVLVERGIDTKSLDLATFRGSISQAAMDGLKTYITHAGSCPTCSRLQAIKALASQWPACTFGKKLQIEFAERVADDLERAIVGATP